MGSLFRDLATQVGEEEEQVELSGSRPNFRSIDPLHRPKTYAPIAAESAELGSLHPPLLSYPDAEHRDG